MEEMEVNILYGRDIRLKVPLAPPGWWVLIQTGDTAVLVTATALLVEKALIFCH